MSENKTTWDDDLVRFLDGAISVGLSHLPPGVPKEVHSLAEQAIAKAMMWASGKIKPDQIKVLVADKASASAEIDWGNESQGD